MITNKGILLYPSTHMEINMTLQYWQLEIKHKKSQTKLKTKIIFYLNAFKEALILCVPFWWFSGHICLSSLSKESTFESSFCIFAKGHSLILEEGCLTLFWLTGVLLNDSDLSSQNWVQKFIRCFTPQN